MADTEPTTAAPAQATERLKPDEVIASQRNRQVLILTVLIVLLAIPVYFTRSGKGKETKVEPAPLAPLGLKAEDVGLIEIWRDKDTPFVLKQDSGGWRVPSRFDAPADQADIDALLQKLLKAERLGKPSTEDTAKFVLYSLDDDEAVHLKLADKSGKPLLELMLGRGEDGSRDFVRLVGADQPKGIFELTGMGADWDTLYSRLQLDADGKTEARRWLDLSSFRVFEQGARISRLVIHDTERTFEFRHDPIDDNKWSALQPRTGDGETPAIQGVLGALENLGASDIAGRDTDAVKLGIFESKRSVVLEYAPGGIPTTVTLTFGVQQEGDVAVALKTQTQGTLIYWVKDYVLGKVFRRPVDFIRRDDLGLLPAGRDATRVRVTDGDKVLDLVRRTPPDAAPQWFMTLPQESRAERLAVSNLLTTLNTLRGFRQGDGGQAQDLTALGLDPKTSGKWLELTWLEPGIKKEGEEKPADVPKTATLYFGTTVAGEVAVLRVVADQPAAVFWLEADKLEQLFVEPDDYRYFEVKVRHILISWKGKNARVTPKDPQRTEAQARALVEEIIKRAKAGEDFVALQSKYNEDSVADNVYDVNPASGFVEPFVKLAGRLNVNEMDTCETDFGIHIMKRVE